MLELKEIRKTYGTVENGFEAVKGLSVAFGSTEFVSVLGPSGCGKTTMLNIIGGLDNYTSGDLIINGISTKDFSARDWDTYRNHSVGFVFQNYNLIPHLNVLENVELALTLIGVDKERRRDKAIEAIISVGLKEQAYKRPNELSGGQMQRVAIARAVVNNPEIVLADEPTGALDRESSLQVMELLKKISKHKLVIMVTHNAELAKTYSTRIVRMDDGKLIGDTNPFILSKHEKPSETNINDSFCENESSKNGNAKIKAIRFSNNQETVLDNLQSVFENIEFAKKVYSQKVCGKKFLVINTDKGKTVAESAYEIRSALKRNNKEILSRGGLSARETEIVKRTFCLTENTKKKDRAKKGALDKPSMSFATALSLSFKNLSSKRFRTFLTAFAGSIGILGVALVISLSNGLNSFISRQEVSLASYPISITTGTVQDVEAAASQIMSVISSDKTTKDLDKIYRNRIVTDMLKTMMHSNEIDSSFVQNMRNLDPDLYYSMFMNYGLNFNIFKTIGKGQQILTIEGDRQNYTRSQYFMKINTNKFWSQLPSKELVLSQYDLIYGDYPKGENEIVLILDNRNRITDVNLFANGLDLSAIDLQSATDNWVRDYDQLVGQEFFLMGNNDYWSNSGKENSTDDPKDDVISEVNKTLKATLKESTWNINVFYDNDAEESNYKIGTDVRLESVVIKGIIRLKDELSVGVLGTNAIGYNTELTDYVLASALNSDIVKNILNKPENSEKTHDELSEQTKKYGYSTMPKSISIYAKNYDCKVEIKNYIDSVNVQREKDNKGQILYSDIMEVVLSLIKQLVNSITYALIALTAVSLVVSSLMIGIITYVSVLERTREIGVLRALGARKLDISNVFNAETVQLGAVSGIIGVVITFLLCFPINTILLQLTGVRNLASLSIMNAVVLVVASIFLTFISGLIPATMASKKDPVKALRTE